MARKPSTPSLPFDLAALRAAGVTRWRYKDARVEIELEMTPATPGEDARERPGAYDGDGDESPDPENDGDGDPRFLLERIADANAKARTAG